MSGKGRTSAMNNRVRMPAPGLCVYQSEPAEPPGRPPGRTTRFRSEALRIESRSMTEGFVKRIDKLGGRFVGSNGTTPTPAVRRT